MAAPIVFLLGFLAVMGRTMDAQGIDYVQYLTPAVVVQTMLFAAMSSGYYVADDEQSGLMARTRSLPLSPAAPVIGRAGGDAARSLLGLSVLTVVGTVVGFRYHGGPVAAIAFWVLAVSFAVALSLGTGLVGLRFGNPRATLEVLNMAYLPLLMISTAFVPAERFPSWLEGIVAHQPVRSWLEPIHRARLGACPPAIARSSTGRETPSSCTTRSPRGRSSPVRSPRPAAPTT